jgi:hypothetical protein
MLRAGVDVKFVEPQPYWQIDRGNSEVIDLYGYQMLQIVNAFLARHLLGEVIEDWTSVGMTYRYQTQAEKIKEREKNEGKNQLKVH